MTIEQQAIGSAFIPAHKFKTNFIEYYDEYVNLNRKGNRHLTSSQKQFKVFIKGDFIAPIDITENLCKRFRQFLLDKYSGETPLNYYTRFKWVVSAAAWSCARLSFSILLQDKNVDDVTIAYLMGHTTTDQVRKTYKRHRPKNQIVTIGLLLTPQHSLYTIATVN